MKCESCQGDANPAQLFQGLCSACLGTQNTTFRLLLAHVMMAIENGRVSEHPGMGTCFNQDFGSAFTRHIRIALSGVKTEKVPPLSSPNLQKCKCGASMTGLWCWDDDQVTDHAFNVHRCDYCGRMLKIMVTDNDRQTWIEMEA